jgi:deoxyribose-phosphate aldolase
MSSTMTSAAVAKLIDHTLLRPDATPEEVAHLCTEASQFGVIAVCVSPNMLPLTGVVPAGVLVATVIGFPSGAHRAEVKADEAARAAAAGADEVDMVINLGWAKSGQWRAVEAEIALVRAAAPLATLKVIIESGVLTDDEVVAACGAAEGAGANFVKTSTGFHPSGGATEHAVRLMKRTVGDRLGIKASGGIRTAEHARLFIEAGATRLGTSATATILAGFPSG